MNNFSVQKINYYFLLWLGSFLVISDWIEKIFTFKFPTGFKHIILLFLLIFLFFINPKKIKLQKKQMIYLLIMAIFLFVNIFISKANYFNYFLGVIFTFLFVFIFIFSSNITLNEFFLIKLVKSFLIFFIIASFYTIINAFIEGKSLRWSPGIFREAGALSSSLNIATIMSLVMYLITKKIKYIYIASFFSLIIFATILKKSIITNIFIWEVLVKFSVIQIYFIMFNIGAI